MGRPCALLSFAPTCIAAPVSSLATGGRGGKYLRFGRTEMADPLGATRTFDISAGRTAPISSLPALEGRARRASSRLSASPRISSEALARSVDGHRVSKHDA